MRPRCAATTCLADLFVAGEIRLHYSHVERLIVGGATPDRESHRAAGRARGRSRRLSSSGASSASSTSAARARSRSTDGPIEMKPRDGLYVGKGSASVAFESQRSRGARQVLSRQRAGPRALRDGEDRDRRGQADEARRRSRPRISARSISTSIRMSASPRSCCSASLRSSRAASGTPCRAICTTAARRCTSTST